MTSFEWIQGLIIGAIVAACVLHVARKLFPRTVNNAQLKMAMSLNRPSRPVVVRRIGNWLQPSMSSGGGCGSGCSSCSSCESNPVNQETKPLEFRRHS
jgi:hypothetical protein